MPDLNQISIKNKKKGQTGILYIMGEKSIDTPKLFDILKNERCIKKAKYVSISSYEMDVKVMCAITSYAMIIQEI